MKRSRVEAESVLSFFGMASTQTILNTKHNLELTPSYLSHFLLWKLDGGFNERELSVNVTSWEMHSFWYLGIQAAYDLGLVCFAPRLASLPSSCHHSCIYACSSPPSACLPIEQGESESSEGLAYVIMRHAAFPKMERGGRRQGKKDGCHRNRNFGLIWRRGRERVLIGIGIFDVRNFFEKFLGFFVNA